LKRKNQLVKSFSRVTRNAVHFAFYQSISYLIAARGVLYEVHNIPFDVVVVDIFQSVCFVFRYTLYLRSPFRDYNNKTFLGLPRQFFFSFFVKLVYIYIYIDFRILSILYLFCFFESEEKKTTMFPRVLYTYTEGEAATEKY